MSLLTQFDTPIPGYKTRTVNRLRLWKSEAVDSFDLGMFNIGDYAGAVRAKMDSKTIGKVPYPPDEKVEGKCLRLTQQFFFTSCSLQDMVRLHLGLGKPPTEFDKKRTVQLNERHGFEYHRHGTLSLYAALDVRTGKVQGKTAPRHTSEEFVSFLGQVVGSCKPKQEIHVIPDNLSAHKTAKVQAFLEEHPRVHLHFTPTYSFLAEPGRDLVCADRARRDRTRRLHLLPRPGPETHALHPGLFQDGSSVQVKVLRCA